MTAASSVSRAASPAALGRSARATVDHDVADGVGEPVARLEGGEVAGGVLLELHDRDGLPDPGAPLGEELVEAEDGGQLRRGVRAADGHALGPAAGLRRRGVGDAVARRPGAGAGRRAVGAGRPATGSRRTATPATEPARPGLSLECSWNRPSRPTTPVTAPPREAGTWGDAVFTMARADSPGARTDSSGVPSAADTAAAVPLHRQQRAARIGRPDGQPLAPQRGGHLGHLGRARAELRRVLRRRQVVAVVG